MMNLPIPPAAAANIERIFRHRERHAALVDNAFRSVQAALPWIESLKVPPVSAQVVAGLKVPPAFQESYLERFRATVPTVAAADLAGPFAGITHAFVDDAEPPTEALPARRTEEWELGFVAGFQTALTMIQEQEGGE